MVNLKSLLVFSISASQCLKTEAEYFYNDQNPLVIANRGSFGAFPEHTQGSYSSAYNDNVDFIGVDLQLSKDGFLVTSHDLCLKNSTNIEIHQKNLDHNIQNTSDSICQNDILVHDLTISDLLSLKRT